MKFVDSHIHLQDIDMDYISKVINVALTNNIEKFVCVTSKYQDFAKLEGLYQKHKENIVVCFGFHPWYLDDIYMERLEEKLVLYPNALVGEIGLDGYKKDFEKQVEVFVSQIELAKKYKRPVIIHCVKANDFFEKNWKILPEKFLFHSYSGKKEFAKKIVDNGGYISFSASILKNKDIKEIYEIIPKNRLLVESDSPYQAESSLVVPEIVFKLAKLLEVDVEVLANRLYENSLEFIESWMIKDS